MNDQATPALFQTDRGSLTADALTAELLYRSYAFQRMRGMTLEQGARFYPSGDAMERRYERETNAGARVADDCFCPGCGARGFRSLCGACDRA